MTWKSTRFVDDGRLEAADRAGCTDPENWMIRPSVAAVEVVAVAVYVHGRDTAGSVGSLFCRTAAEEDVISMAASTAQAAAADTTRIPGQSGGDLFQGACAAWGGDRAAV